MPGLTPIELYDVLETALDAAPGVPWRRKEPVVWFTVPQVAIDGAVWRARVHDADRYGYTAAQARQMRRELLPVLGAYLQAAESLTRSIG